MSLFGRIFGTDETPDEDIRKQFNAEVEEYEQAMKQAMQQQAEPAQQLEVPQEQQRHGARVIFMVEDNGEVSITMQWTSTQEEVAEALGTVLYFINSGKLAQQCENVLNGTMQQNPQVRPFIKKVGRYWQESMKSHEQVVKPSEVFQLGRQNITRPNQAGGPKEGQK